MDAIPLNFAWCQMRDEDLESCLTINEMVLQKRAGRLSVWLKGAVIDEIFSRQTLRDPFNPSCAREGTGFVMMDAHTWSNLDLADGLRACWAASNAVGHVGVGEFLDAVLTGLVASVCDRLKNPPVDKSMY